ncbi:hypothetical protein HDU78_009349 [Chytriomyces hyalinus]|nr:hypothetical protein HDU78_009349 [Chytriomyces hyalinus]
MTGSKRVRTEDSSAVPVPPVNADMLATILSALDDIKAQVTAIKDTQLSIISDITVFKETQRHLSIQVQRLVNHKERFYSQLQDLPLEIVDLIFSWIPVWAVFKYRRLSRSINERLLTKQFAVLNMHLPDFEEGSEHNLGRLWLLLPELYQSAVARELAGRVTSVDLKFKRVKKRLPESIGCLTGVERIELDGCKLRGTIPDAFGALSNLTTVLLSENSLTGALPSSFSLLSGLRHLNLCGNRLSGEFPALPNSNLESVYISRNQFTGPIPTVFGNPRKLTTLWADENRFTAIPSSISQLTNLGELVISGNTISSEIIPEFWELRALTILEMSGCSLFGTLAGVGALSNLEALDLSDNQFSGEIPSREIESLQGLHALHLVRNQFSGWEEGLLHMPQMPNLASICLDGEALRNQVNGYRHCQKWSHRDQNNDSDQERESGVESEFNSDAASDSE